MADDQVSCGETMDARELALAVEFFAVLANPDRLRLVVAMGHEELSVNLLADITDMDPVVIQQHLATLEVVGVVSSRQYGDRSFYGVCEPALHLLIADRTLRGLDTIDRMVPVDFGP